MSKLDAVRAMREARYAEAQARTAGAKPQASAMPQPSAKPKATAKPAAKDGPAEQGPEQPAAAPLCGHRNISGRTCTRERDHTAKTHRYS